MIGTGVLAGSIIVRLADITPAQRPKSVNIIGIHRNAKYCGSARTHLNDLARWAVNHGFWVEFHVFTGDCLNPLPGRARSRG